MTFQDMIDRVKYTLGMQEIISYDESVFIKAYINEGVIDVLVRTRPYTRQMALQLTPNTPIHDMSSAILALLDIQHPSYGFLERFSREDITTAQAGGNPGFAYEEPLLWISPIPEAEMAVTAYGVFRPDPLVGGADDCQLPNYGGLSPEFHPAVINYACWKAGEYVQHEGSAMGDKWRILYEGADGTGGDISRIKKILTKRVTPAASRRRDLTGSIGGLSDSGSYMGSAV